MSNTIQPSRKKPSVYIDVMKQLNVKENGAYTDDLSQGAPALQTNVRGDVNKLSTDCQQDVSKLSTNCQHRLD